MSCEDVKAATTCQREKPVRLSHPTRPQVPAKVCACFGLGPDAGIYQKSRGVGDRMMSETITRCAGDYDK